MAWGALQCSCLKKNPKFEYRNPKQIQMTKIQMIKTKKLKVRYNAVFV